jgi:tetratricopeptide (TPR) repeat protein
VSGGIAWTVAERLRSETSLPVGTPSASVAQPSRAADAAGTAPATGTGAADFARVETVSMADAQYDAAVSDLEKALKAGRDRLDASTIAIVEHNLQIIDQAINQAREALASDPANSYLSSHLVEARRRKLDLLRRATALATETD